MPLPPPGISRGTYHTANRRRCRGGEGHIFYGIPKEAFSHIYIYIYICIYIYLSLSLSIYIYIYLCMKKATSTKGFPPSGGRRIYAPPPAGISRGTYHTANRGRCRGEGGAYILRHPEGGIFIYIYIIYIYIYTCV